MSYEDEFHAPGYYSAVKRQTALDMLSDEELINELVKRHRLTVVIARRRYPIDMHDRPGLLQAVTNKLGSDIGEYLTSHQLLSMDEEYNYRERFMHYSATTIVLNPTPEERPL